MPQIGINIVDEIICWNEKKRNFIDITYGRSATRTKITNKEALANFNFSNLLFQLLILSNTIIIIKNIVNLKKQFKTTFQCLQLVKD